MSGDCVVISVEGLFWLLRVVAAACAGRRILCLFSIWADVLAINPSFFCSSEEGASLA